MSIEASVDALLKTICPRAFAVVAVGLPAKPYLVWQSIGGESARFLDNTAADKRNTYLQISAWGVSHLEAITLIRQAEDAMCASTDFSASPSGEPLSTYEPDTKLFGCIQRFSVWAAR